MNKKQLQKKPNTYSVEHTHIHIYRYIIYIYIYT